MESLDIEIRDKLAKYLANEISLEEFQDWFVPGTWEVRESGNTSAIELSAEIALRLAEFSNGHWTELSLREKLRPLLESYVVRVSCGTTTVSTSYSGITMHQQVLIQHVGIVYAKAS